VTGIPRYRGWDGPVVLSAGFRPFFLAAGLWAAIAAPLWVVVYTGSTRVPTILSPAIWHAHEMVFGFAAATVAGFMLTAIPNWTGRMPLQGWTLGTLVLLWAVGRLGVLLSGIIGADAGAALDLAFPVAFLSVVAREIISGRNWRNLPMIAALVFLLFGNALVHLQTLGIAETALAGDRLGIATLLMLISLVGGRIIPSFTRNWLTKNHPSVRSPASFGGYDRAVLAATLVALVDWTMAPESQATPWLCLLTGVMHGVRLARWQGLATWREPLVLVLHVGYGWLGLGFCLFGLNALVSWLPETAALHALTVGAIGTMTLAVMTRATLGHSGRTLTAGPGTTFIYALVTMAAVSRVLVPIAGAHYVAVLWLSAICWSSAFGLFVLLYLEPLVLSLHPALSRTRER
jgi:uncharacterized protein involved in response to NO